MVDEIPGTADMLRDVLEDAGIIKVLHDCRQDAAALQVQAGIQLKTIFDTQARPEPYTLNLPACLPVCLPVCLSVYAYAHMVSELVMVHNADCGSSSCRWLMVCWCTGSHSCFASTDRKMRRLGLEDLLRWAGLPSHTFKSGIALIFHSWTKCITCH